MEIDSYLRLFNFVGFGIVDNSFFPNFVPDVYFQLDEEHRLPILDEQIDFFDALRDRGIPEHIVFPSEFFDEFDRRTELMVRWSSGAYHEGMRIVASRMGSLRTTRELFSQVMRMRHSLEDTVQYRSERPLLPLIYAACHDVAARHNVFGDKPLESDSFENDLGIYAKAYGIAATAHDVALLVADADFERLHNAVVEETSDPSSQARQFYGLDPLEHDLSIVSRYGTKLILSSKDLGINIGNVKYRT